MEVLALGAKAVRSAIDFHHILPNATLTIALIYAAHRPTFLVNKPMCASESV